MTSSTTPIITRELVLLDAAVDGDKQAVIARLAESLAAAGRTGNAQGLIGAAMAREAQSATGLPGGIAIPHCRSPYVDTPTIGFARLKPAVDFGAPDGPADLAFLIAAPDSGGQEHMKLLSSLARALVRKDFVESLRNAGSTDEVVELVEGVVNPAPAAAAPAAPVEKPAAKTLVAITACPTGIAHTYMAADALALAAKEAGVTLVVETQGSSGSTPLPSDTIAKADAVIFATDVGVKDKGRFAGKPVVASGVKRAINEPAKMIAEAVAAADNPNAARVEGSGSAAPDAPSGNVGWGTRTRQILLTGVSYMIPFVAAGGLLIALGFLLAGFEIANTADGATSSYGNTIALGNSLFDLPDPVREQPLWSWLEPLSPLMTYLGAVLFSLGGLAFGFLVPALAGYIAFAIADRPGLAPGFTAGAVAGFLGAGFIGGIVGGVIAGFAALWISRFGVPQWFRGLMPVVIIPLFASMIVGLAMFVVLGRPLAAINTGLTNWLNGLTGTSAVLLGVILGLMMCFDLGGPVNKAAYAFATAGLAGATTGSYQVMAAVMAAGMVPPLALALASAVRPALFTEPERENGRAAWLLGASFISEGAIPFAAADPLRVIPSMMVGGAITGALCMGTGVTLRAPHGGIFVFFAIGNLLWFLIALIAGTVVSAVAVIAAKQFIKSGAKSESELVAA